MKIARIAQTLLAIAAGLSIGMARAAPLNVLGFDDMSCAAWNKAKGDQEQRTAYIVWIRGFLSGHNYALPNQQVSTISSGTIEVNINSYCSATPAGSFSDGAMRLSDQFSGRNQPVRR
ncbi:MAG: hypothetical protein H6R15_3610 [Proteobacteria bacterium]|nr:hypothetical protein [Pseudomonadota bacterium]